MVRQRLVLDILQTRAKRARVEAFRRLPGLEQARRLDAHDPVACRVLGRTRPIGIDDQRYGAVVVAWL